MLKLANRSDGSILYLSPLGPQPSRVEDVALRFIEVHGRPYVLYPAATPPDWVSWATSGLVRWRIGTETFEGHAAAIGDGNAVRAEVLPEFAATFGADRVSRWFGPQVGCLALSESPNGGSYYDTIEALFDQASRNYDRTVLGDPLNLHLRAVSSKILRNLFAPGDRVLEMGCGTGLETIPLAQAGVKVVALDISSKMLEELEQKARAASVSDCIETRKGPLNELSSILSDFEPGSFDGAFSHFGALNCEPDLANLPGALHRLVGPDGRISLGVLNRTSLAEMILFTARLRARRGFARLRSDLPVGQSQFGVQAFPYGPREVRRLFSPLFEEEAAMGVSVLLPPPHLGRRLLQHPRLISILESLDNSVSRRPLFRYLGDYFLMQLVRR